MHARNRHGFGWKRWSKKWLYGELDYLKIAGSVTKGIPAYKSVAIERI